ncbi:MAG TPA: asparagine synthase (glutamine-hydrolyzing) [Chitinophagaceae bacterium]|nr:asparagine synthase (glutamine-hydrolyzing) [Chitinophagaceae bacterium]
MCGIAGIIAFNETGRQRVPKIQQSIRTLESRGPDDEGIYCTRDLGLGQKRLSIIDTSKEANQPIWSHDGRYVIIYNGEIFNYKQLRSTHFSTDEQRFFKTNSDTEVLLELFVKKSHECLPLLEGFFAFAIFDTQEKTLFIARDRFGKKPISFYQDENIFVFASELKALFAFDIPRQLNYEALKLYFQFAYIPQPLSILEQVEKVRPGHYLILKNGIREEKKWYDLPLTKDYSTVMSYEAAQTKLEELLEESVVDRLISDVSLGAFLSGGIDSSVIVALASRHQEALNTFSIGFKEENFFDETHFAELVARKFKTNHTSFTLGVDDYLNHIYDVLNYLDEPFADTSALPQFILSMETRKHATVAISGDGGDEVFAGYNKHHAEWQARRKSIKSTLIKAASPLWKVLPKGRNTKMTNLFRQLDRFSEAAHLSSKERYWRWASTFSENEVEKLLQPGTLTKVDSSMVENIKTGYLSGIKDDDFNSVLKTDLDLILTGDMLVKVDLMSMANSLEVRCPFLDHRVVEFAFTLPADYKIKGNVRKRIVKDTFRNLLPEEIYNRGKMGFEIPLLSWFRNELHSFVFDELLCEKVITEQGIFNFSFIERMKNQLHSNKSGNVMEQLWVLIVFQYWYKKYFL